MLDCLPGLWSPEENSVGASWCPQGKLVEGDSLTTSGGDSGASGGSEPQSCNGELWEGQLAGVIGDSSYDDDCLVGLKGLLVVDISENARQGDWWAVDLGGE